MSRINLFALAALAFLPAGSWTPSPADLTRAVALAQKGAQDAEAKLKAAFPFRAFEAGPRAFKFWGADLTESVEPPAGSLLEEAANPSFAVEVDGDPSGGDPAPRTLRIGGAKRGVSGIDAAGTYAAGGDHYALRVSDLSGRLYINDGVDGGAAGSVSQNLKRILNVLGDVVGEEKLGLRILASRPAGGYPSLEALVPVLGQASFAKVRGFLTAHAWIDRNVANPVPLSESALPKYPVAYDRGTPALYRFGSSLDSAGNEVVPAGGLNVVSSSGPAVPSESAESRIFGLDTLNPQWIEIVGRAPVNVNVAPREVLIALLTGLQGFYVSERKRNNARWQGELYTSITLQNSFSPTRTTGEDYGVLVETHPVPAQLVADEIVACRVRKATAFFNYATVPWSGPFRTWSQFNLFADNLVSTGVLDDPRPIHVRYSEEAVDPTGFGSVVQDSMARLHAVRAIADVLKANFNPNLHLNELNPDANLHLRVDKTDLFVNSTEFCFAPTGYFEVESLGRVVRPTKGEADAFLAANNHLVAQAKVAVVLKLYDLYRESTQKQFYGGTMTARTSAIETNNNASIEIGPEPDNGVFPGNLGAPGTADNEWDGYLALPTVGSVWHGSPVKAKNTLVRTTDLAAAPQFGSAMHVHYTLDTDACDHVLDRREIAGRALEDEQVSNLADHVAGAALTYGGPYDPTRGNHRLARSFRRGAGPAPALAPFAPSDLRIDGAYAERHAAPAYFLQKTGASLWDFSVDKTSGMASFWFKPSFFPELTGKVRKLWDVSRYHDACAQAVNLSPFQMVFMPVHYNYAVSEAGGPMYWHNNMGRFQPCSMYFGSLQWHGDSGQNGPMHAFGKITSSLNHIGHPDEGLNPSPLQAHKWINATLMWGLTGSSDNTVNISSLQINGTSAYTAYSYATMTGWNEYGLRMAGFDKHSGGAYNHLRMGGTSRICDAAASIASFPGAYKGNTSSDVTIDELHVWKTPAAGGDTLWLRGRYYNLRGQTGNTGRFTSQTFGLPAAAGSKSKLLGVSWTWFGETTDTATGARKLFDYGDNTRGMAGRDLDPHVRVSVVDGGVVYGPYDDDGFSPVLTTGGTPPSVESPSQTRYAVAFDLSTGGAAPLLLATPVLDDVTIYWSDGRSSARVDSASPLVIADPATLPDAKVREPYTATFVSSGPTPVVWSVADGSLPGGLALDGATGALTGTPRAGGTFTFLVAAESGSESAFAEYTLTVDGGSGGGGGGGGCGLLGLEALLLILLCRVTRNR